MKKIGNSLKRYYFLLAVLLLLTVNISCKKYLDAKTDKQLVVPSSLEDAQALLDLYSLFNSYYSSIGNESDDNYFLSDTYVSTMPETKRNIYTWAPEALSELDWSYMYQIVLNCNIAIETVDKQPVSIAASSKAKTIKGSALFFRANAFYQLAQCYALPYDKAVSATLPGIPLRLNSDASSATIRASLETSWQQIVSDLKNAIQLLPEINSPLSRPSKAAGYALLARTYLTMDEYELAGKYADSSLSINGKLLNYNLIDSTIQYPFQRLNEEVLFSAISFVTSALYPPNFQLDTTLYASYDKYDLRRKLYFQNNANGTMGFQGSYDGSGNPFNGIANDEVLLIRAECYARLEKKEKALTDLNNLLITRWQQGHFIPYTANSAEEALSIILDERRKELVERGIRWWDLRRLNKDARFAKTLKRNIDGTIFQLAPNDAKYTFLIPSKVISITGIEQNKR